MPIVDPRLTLPALALALGSAALHAAWNLLLAGRKDVQAAAAATFVLSVAFAAAARRHLVERGALGLALRARLGAARDGLRRRARLCLPGRRPLVRLPAHARRSPRCSPCWRRSPCSGTRSRPPRSAGVLLVAGGVVLVRGPEGSADARAMLAVATISASIAAYTLVDRVGIQHAGALTYFVLVLAGPALVYPPIVGIAAVRRRDRAGHAWSLRSRTSARSCSACSRCAAAPPRPCSRCARRRS